MMPVFVKKINFLNYPIDNNMVWKGRRILGNHKTWRGIFFGTLSGALVFELQKLLYSHGYLTKFALVDYSHTPFFLGSLLGFSALFGDAVKSFFKRRINIRPGGAWIPFDQLDFMLAAILLSLPWTGLGLKEAFLILAIVFFSTMLVQYTGYKLKFKSDKL